MAAGDSEEALIPSIESTPEKQAKKNEEKGFQISSRSMAFSTLTAIFLWLYSFINIAVINTDALILSFLPIYMTWLVKFKLLVILSSVCILWIFLGTKRFLLSFCYVAFFPVVVVLIAIYSLGRYVLETRSWILVLAFVEAITSILTKFKVRLITTTLFLSAATYIFVGESRSILVASAFVMLFLVLIAYIRSFMSAASPPSTFRLLTTFLRKDEQVRYKAFRLDDEIRDKPVSTLSSTQITKWNNALQTSIIYNRLMLFYARAMRDYQRSNLLFIPGIFTIFRLISFTVIGFAFINYAYFKVEPAAYKVSDQSAFFKFFYYSFNSLVLNGVDEVKPAQMVSQALLMFQELLSFVLAIILVSLFVSYRTQRASSDLDRAIKIAEEEAVTVEGWLQREFKVASIARAIEHLKHAEGNLVNFIHWLSRGI